MIHTILNGEPSMRRAKWLGLFSLIPGLGLIGLWLLGRDIAKLDERIARRRMN